MTIIVVVVARGGFREKYLEGARQKVDDFFSHRPQNTGQNYQINHSNLQKTPPV